MASDSDARREGVRFILLPDLMFEKLHFIVVRDLALGVYDHLDSVRGLFTVVTLAIYQKLNLDVKSIAYGVCFFAHMHHIILVNRLRAGALRAWCINVTERVSRGATAASHDDSELLSARDVVVVTVPVAQVQARREVRQNAVLSIREYNARCKD